MGAWTATPIQAASRPEIKTGGRLRKKQANCYDKPGYDGHQPKAETLFCVEKKTIGSYVLARALKQQQKELVFRALAQNGRRIESLSLLGIEVLYTASCGTPQILKR